MEPTEFKQKLNAGKLERGTHLKIKTGHSISVGFLEGWCPKANVPFIVLAGTRKIEQGRDNEDWYDHTFSIPFERIKSATLLH
jgi:hypothetical protein